MFADKEEEVAFWRRQALEWRSTAEAMDLDHRVSLNKIANLKERREEEEAEAQRRLSEAGKDLAQAKTAARVLQEELDASRRVSRARQARIKKLRLEKDDLASTLARLSLKLLEEQEPPPPPSRLEVAAGYLFHAVAIINALWSPPVLTMAYYVYTQVF